MVRKSKKNSKQIQIYDMLVFLKSYYFEDVFQPKFSSEFFFPSHAFLRKKALIRVRNRRDFENGI